MVLICTYGLCRALQSVCIIFIFWKQVLLCCSIFAVHFTFKMPSLKLVIAFLISMGMVSFLFKIYKYIWFPYTIMFALICAYNLRYQSFSRFHFKLMWPAPLQGSHALLWYAKVGVLSYTVYINHDTFYFWMIDCLVVSCFYVHSNHCRH